MSDSSSVIVIAKSSSKTGLVSEKRTPCFLKLLSALRTSHSKTILPSLYVHFVHTTTPTSSFSRNRQGPKHRARCHVPPTAPVSVPYSLFTSLLTSRPPKAHSCREYAGRAGAGRRPTERDGGSCDSSPRCARRDTSCRRSRSEEHTSELQ